MTVLLLFLLAHCIGDFVLQTDRIAQYKEDGRLKGFLLHGIGIFLGLVLLTFPIFSFSLLFIEILGTLLHIGVDYGKMMILETYERLKQRKYSGIQDMAVFLVDQALHVGLIVLMWKLFQAMAGPETKTDFYSTLYNKAVAVFNSGTIPKASVPDLDVFLITGLIYIFVCFGGSVIVSKTLIIFITGSR